MIHIMCEWIQNFKVKTVVTQPLNCTIQGNITLGLRKIDVKGTVYLKMKIQLLSTHPHVDVKFLIPKRFLELQSKTAFAAFS